MSKQRLCRKQDPNSQEITILDDLSGTVRPGEYLAIIGASGAGKTTLLNYLSGKDPSKNLKKLGEVLINGVDRSKVNFKNFVAYVQQDDVLIQTMTVRECLMFAAQLKLPPSVDHKEKVDALIESLKLERAADMLIGGSLIGGIIGGERKCTSIGVELITDPSLIFLDEPTTGLDSFTATTIVEVMADLAKSGRTVISTIHQPNSEIFEKFGKLMLMAQGHTIYLNKAYMAVDYFSSIGYSCPARTNPADFFMEIMSIETNEVDGDEDETLIKRKSQVEIDYKKKIEEMHRYYENSELRCDAEFLDPEANNVSLQDNSSKYRAPFCKQFCQLFTRDIKGVIRNPHSSRIQLISIIIIAIMIILIYGKLGDNAQSIQGRTGVTIINI